jgi:acyl-CoA thioesterase-1
MAYKGMKSNKIRYAALGDSYTIGEGARIEESWPVILTRHLLEKGMAIDLVANPSVTGWTTQDLIDKGLPVFDSSAANFATLLIGVNDWVQKFEKERFHFNFNFIVEHIQRKLADKRNLVILSIPDFAVSPNGHKYSYGRDISVGLSEFNEIIMEEAKIRGLKMIDLFPISQQMKDKPELFAADGIHPSAKAYSLWESLVLPVVFELLV